MPQVMRYQSLGRSAPPGQRRNPKRIRLHAIGVEHDPVAIEDEGGVGFILLSHIETRPRRNNCSAITKSSSQSMSKATSLFNG